MIIRIKNTLIPVGIILSIALSWIFIPLNSMAGDRFSKKRFIGKEDAPWQITARSLTYKEKEGVYIAKGDVVITKAGQSLYAQDVVYNMKTGMAELSGDVRLEAAGDLITGESASLDLNNQTGRIIKGNLFIRENHYYISGDLMEKLDEDTYLFKDCTLTTCDGPDPDWVIKSKEVKVTVEGYGTIKHASFRAGGLPILYVPYMIFPAKTKRQSGLLPPRAGYSERNGADFELPFFWAISDQTDVTFYQRFMSKRGYMQGLELRYLEDDNSNGTLQFDILSDRKEKDMTNKDDLELSPYKRSNRTRYWLRGMVDQDLPLGLDVRLDMDFVSDQDYLREFEQGLFGLESREDLKEEFGRPTDDKRSPTRRSALRLGHDGQEYSLQALASYYEDPEHPPKNEMAQPLGGLNFALLPQQIKRLPAFFGLGSSYDYIWRDVGKKGHGFSISPDMRFPTWFFRDYLEIEPSIKYIFNTQWVDDPDGVSDRQNIHAYEAGLRMATNVERVYDFNWINTRKLKHRLAPVLTYKYRSHHNQGESPWFEPVDQESKINGVQNEISLTIENYLNARMEDKKGRTTYRQWAYFDISQGYDIEEARSYEEENEPLTPLSASLIVTPFNNLDLRGTAKWDHYEHQISYTSMSMDLSIDRSGGRKDIFEIDYLYIKDKQKSLNFWIDVNLAHGFSVGSSLERDMELDENISSGFWLGYQSQCWGMKLGAKRADGDTSIMVVFNLLGLGEL